MNSVITMNTGTVWNCLDMVDTDVSPVMFLQMCLAKVFALLAGALFCSSVVEHNVCNKTHYNSDNGIRGIVRSAEEARSGSLQRTLTCLCLLH